MDREQRAMSGPVTGRSLGLLVCLECRATVRAAAATHSRCPRCRAALHSRKPHSLLITTLLIVAAAILYVPANLLPVMDSRTLIDDEYDHHRMSGVLVLLQSGSWPIALLVFFASIVVPLLKILALAVLVYSAWAWRSPAGASAAERVVSDGRIHRTLVDARYICHFSAGDAGASPVIRPGHRRLGRMGLRRRGGPDAAGCAHFRRAVAVGRPRMTEPTPPPPNLDDLPEAIPARSRWSGLPLIWILPAVVVLAGAFVVIHEKLAQGTDIEIRFHNAEDLEANKTKIRYKDVEIGDVRDIHVSKDRKEVVVTAIIHRDASEYLVEDTRFWVVRPRISAAGVTGLSTLVSGAYISVEVGQDTKGSKQFVGLEVPPIVTADLPGREFVLNTDDLGSLNIASLVFYRHIIAGQGRGLRHEPGRQRRNAHHIHQCSLRFLCHRRYALLAGKRHRHVDQFRRSETAHRVAHFHPARRYRLSRAARRRAEGTVPGDTAFILYPW